MRPRRVATLALKLAALAIIATLSLLEEQETGHREERRQPRQHQLPLWWWGALLIVAIVAVLFGMSRYQFPDWITRSSSRIPTDQWNRVVAIYVLGAILAHGVIHNVLRWLERPFGLTNEPEQWSYWPPTIVGLIESILYTSSFLVGRPEFIAVWLGLKVAGHWDLWQEGQAGRARFNRALVGNGMAIMISGVTYGAIVSFVCMK